ncbi:MAG: hypothetical protein KKF67_03215 [Nanoarchaeota archaeon]|nr:hypothetical protein [Nanoarchaeota archaeon]
MPKLKKCESCKIYTMKESCEKCKTPTTNAHYKFVKTISSASLLKSPSHTRRQNQA